MKKKLRIILIIICGLIIIYDLIYADFNNLDKSFWLNIISATLVILGLFLSIRESKKNKID